MTSDTPNFAAMILNNYMTKNTTFAACAVALVLGLGACKNETSKSESTLFTTYVDSINTIQHVYTPESWEAINADYQNRVAALEQKEATMEADEKARVEESKAKFAALKATYEENIAKAATPQEPGSKAALRNRLFGEGVITEDLKFSFVSAANALSVYETFVNTVDANKDNYSREDWDEIKVLYEALDTRKNEIEKELSGPDNRQIASLKVKFAGINTSNRSGAKADENAEAKKNN